MKKIIALLSLSIFFISCEKTDEISNDSQPPSNFFLKELLGEENYIDYDSSIDITGTVNLTPYEPEIDEGSMNISASFSEADQVGGILINDRILVSKNDGYYKDYSSEQNEQLAIDKAELFGNTIKLKTIDTNEASPYFNLALEAALTSRMEHFEVEGLEALDADVGKTHSVIRSNGNLEFRWSVTGNPDENMMLIVYESKDVGNGNAPKQLLKRFKNSDGAINISGAELNKTFVDDSDLIFMFVKGKQVVNAIPPSNKIFSVNSMEFINYTGIKFVK